jgi:hypothetical protein
MDTKDKIRLANEILGQENQVDVTRIRADKGLFERTSSSRIILTEDNKELLMD